MCVIGMSYAVLYTNMCRIEIFGEKVTHTHLHTERETEIAILQRISNGKKEKIHRNETKCDTKNYYCDYSVILFK